MQGQSAMEITSGQEEAIINYIVCSLVILFLLLNMHTLFYPSACAHAVHENASSTS